MIRPLMVILALVLPMLITAQNRFKEAQPLEIRSSRYWLDIDYVGDRHIGHRMDIHLPQKEETIFPAVICIYGSAFFSNSSKAAAFREGIGQYLLANDFAVVTINHRASSDAHFPAQIHDVKAAIRFIRANGGEYGIDTSFIGITGWSSGGHLAAIAGTTGYLDSFEIGNQVIDLKGNLGKHLNMRSHVNAVVDWFGPTDFLIMDECGSAMVHNASDSPESLLVGGDIQSMKLQCEFADPATYASENNPPFLIFHGDKDPLVPLCQSEHLNNALKENGADVKLQIINDGGHGPGVFIDNHYNKMVSFFRSKMVIKY